MEIEEGAIKWLEQLDEVHRIEAVRESFAKVAATQEGKIVFIVLLGELFYILPATTPEQVALSNFAKEFVAKHFGEHAQARVLEALLARSD